MPVCPSVDIFCHFDIITIVQKIKFEDGHGPIKGAKNIIVTSHFTALALQ